jgi:hypothetical protein
MLDIRYWSETHFILLTGNNIKVLLTQLIMFATVSVIGNGLAFYPAMYFTVYMGTTIILEYRIMLITL